MGKAQKNDRRAETQLHLVSSGGLYELQELEDKIIHARAEDVTKTAGLFETSPDSPEEKERKYAVHEGIAIIEIKGPLVARTTWMSRMYGATSYEDIREQLVDAIVDAEVSQVLIDADTPGGQVNGVGEAASLIKKMSAVKPVSVYAGGNLLSAGYWLAVAADNIYAADTAFVGSIGVVITHTSYQKAMEKAGVKVTKIKSGDNKQVGSQEKDLSDKDKSYLQAQVDDLFAIFRSSVVASRPAVDPRVFDGSEFVADKALAMGLIDRVMSFDDVLTHLINKYESNGGSSMAKTSLTTEQLAAAAASGLVLDEETSEVIKDGAGTENGAEAKTEAEIAAEAANAEAEANTESEATSEEGGETEGEVMKSTLETYLEGKVSEATEKAVSLEVENTSLKAETETLTANVDQLKKIAVDTIGRMRIALGMAKVDMNDMSAEILVKEFDSISAQAAKVFKVGGLTSNKEGEGESKASAKITRIDEARNTAVGLG